MVYTHHTRCGVTVCFELSRRARTRLILRVAAPNLLRISLPPQCGQRILTDWLRQHEDVLLDYWQRAQSMPIPAEAALAQDIWFLGRRCAVHADAGVDDVCWRNEQTLAMPTGAAGRAQLACWLYAQAETLLLSRLQDWSVRLPQQPVASGLTGAQTFWGICRPRTGIRLNWRLVGAPDWVADYVCIHELCHLVHLNHSADFWALVAEYTAHTRTAKHWLKAHGAELFALG